MFVSLTCFNHSPTIHCWETWVMNVYKIDLEALACLEFVAQMQGIYGIVL